MNEAGFGRLVSRRTTLKVAVISPTNEDAINYWLERAGEQGLEVLEIRVTAGYISRGKGGDIDAREKRESVPSICLISYAEPAKE